MMHGFRTGANEGIHRVPAATLTPDGDLELRTEVTKVKREQKSWAAKAKELPRKVLPVASAQVKKRYEALKNRYGPRYTNAMLGVAFFTFFSPIPGSLLVGAALIVVVATG